ncbi:hypothetical protein NDU88_002908 [Pleurodeles waltl]|uniref:Uncharacterized protein n=1 Tax=Pleurodeles waltl TaxID=8319 RepID=A0AAV7WMK6_PLEWA|nr:hypothetical protein NDU88_002908 [Pleurodeles waltl]
MSILIDIRQALLTLTTPPPTIGMQTTAQVVLTPALQAQGSAPHSAPAVAQAPTQDATTQALLSVVQLLSSLDTSSASVPPTARWATTDTLKNTLAELNHQISAITVVRIIGTVATGTTGSGDIPSPGVQSPIPNNVDKGKITESNTNKSGGVSLLMSAGQDTLLSQPGKRASHLAADVKEKIWKGEFVDIFSLIRAKRGEVEVKDKEGKASSSNDKNPESKRI